MSLKIFGNTKGLASSEKRRLEKLAHRRIGKQEIVTLDLAREIYTLAHTLRRRIGLLISREGDVEEIAVGTKEILYLPDLGRYRLGQGRLRRLRLIFSDLSNGPEVHIPHDIYTDLEKLRLDMVVGVKSTGNKTSLKYAHLAPNLSSEIAAAKTEFVPDLGKYEFDFGDFMSELEQELSALVVEGKSHAEAKAVLVGVSTKKTSEVARAMAEMRELARTAGVEVADVIVQKKDPDPKTLIGKGKLEEVVLRCLRLGADLIIFESELKPSQWRAITNSTELKVLDRSMLILDIFAQRASSSEGRLQVELAQLKYNLPRLVELDAGLSRLTGGIGGRGPGETKLEIGRRRIRDRIIGLEKRIEKLSEERGLRKQKRKDFGLPLVSILGYTNVGKSTLFNALTGSNVIVENKLFATLDPAQRRLVIPPQEGDEASFGTTVILSDTVGFIRELPEELRAAFRATLEELQDAKLLIHVIDAQDDAVEEQFRAVEEILEEMKLLQLPRLIVANKVDAVEPFRVRTLVNEFNAIPVSALTKVGLDELKQHILRQLQNVKAEEQHVS